MPQSEITLLPNQGARQQVLPIGLQRQLGQHPQNLRFSLEQITATVPTHEEKRKRYPKKGHDDFDDVFLLIATL